MNLRRDVFQAIADPTRRAILLLVASQSMTAGAIAANFNTARPTVSKHLQNMWDDRFNKLESIMKNYTDQTHGSKDKNPS
ncbi:winged helix-turn-helix transcriptional regulator [Sphingobacterium sp. N143]|nr:winged helix-turn-helix transcriptional regulator [Sphingobacterium sp. N143]